MERDDLLAVNDSVEVAKRMPLASLDTWR